MNPADNLSRRDFLKLGGVAAGMLATSGLVGSALAGENQTRPNILMVMVDTLRADHVGCYGYGSPTTPTIDALAKEGMRFENAFSASSWTTPSVMSAFTSLLPREHGVVDTTRTLPGKVTTLAWQLRQHGYHTCAVLCNPCASAKMGFDSGFDVYDDFTILLNTELNVFDVMGESGQRSINTVTTSREIADLSLKYLRQSPDNKPWFMFVLLFDPHADYVPPRRYARMFDTGYHGKASGQVYGLGGNCQTIQWPDKADRDHVISLYNGEIRYADDELGRFLQLAKAEKLLNDNTLMVVTADHGEEFNEHGGSTHGHSLYEELVRIPLVMRWPGRIPAGKVCPAQVQSIDLAPTLLSLIGAPAAQGFGGRDLSPLLNGSGTLDREKIMLHTHLNQGVAAVRTPQLKVIEQLGSGEVSGFDLRNDPLEQEPLAGEALRQHAQLAPLAAELVKWNSEAATAFSKRKAEHKAKPQLTAQQIKALKAMGYVH